MHVIRNAAGCVEFHLILAGNTAHVGIKSDGEFRRYQILPLTRTKDAMMKLAVVCVRHIYLRYCGTEMKIPAIHRTVAIINPGGMSR